MDEYALEDGVHHVLNLVLVLLELNGHGRG